MWRVVCFGVAGAAANLAQDYEGYNFEQYLREQEKSYETASEYSNRKAIFEENLVKVKAHNAEYNAGKHTWYAAMGPLADRTKEEFQALRSAKYAPSEHPVVDLSTQSPMPNPDSVDWRERGAVTAVKNQGGCGSCWAFSATETLESMYQIATNKTITLAPQTFVNCVKNPHQCGGTGGCGGATTELAFGLTKDKGIALESDLPYRGKDQFCRPYKAAVKCSGYVKNPVNDAKALETALATKGPQSISVAATTWQLYGGGIFHGCSSNCIPFCDNTLDHAVQLVGYTKDYWIIRNSWGAKWGEKGFIRVTRANDAKTFVDSRPKEGVACKPIPKSQTVGGECGLLFDTNYPTGVTDANEGTVVV